MPIPVLNFPIKTFEQSQPELMGARATTDLLANTIDNQRRLIAARYMQPQLDEQLNQLRLNTDILRPQAEYAPQFTQASLADALMKAPKVQAEIDRIYQGQIPMEQEHARYYRGQADIAPQQLSLDRDKALSTKLLNEAHINVLNEQAKYRPWEKQERTLELMEAKENAKAYSQEFKEVNESAKDAIQMKNLINQFENAYSKIDARGPVIGKIPAFTAEAQMADNAAQNMQQMILKLMKTNRMTNYELQFAGNLKLNRAMQPETVKDIGNFLKAKSDRLIEEQKFFNSAKKKGIEAEEARTLWNAYDNERPVYDFEKRRINKNNIKTSQDYLNPERLETTLYNQSYAKQGLSNGIENQKNINGRQYIQINGEWYLQ
ncbi:hypothetical protein HGB13_00295 [bacterium]|nr:hypothetical protein [bacterium]